MNDALNKVSDEYNRENYLEDIFYPLEIEGYHHNQAFMLDFQFLFPHVIGKIENYDWEYLFIKKDKGIEIRLYFTNNILETIALDHGDDLNDYKDQIIQIDKKHLIVPEIKDYYNIPLKKDEVYL